MSGIAALDENVISAASTTIRKNPEQGLSGGHCLPLARRSQLPLTGAHGGGQQPQRMTYWCAAHFSTRHRSCNEYFVIETRGRQTPVRLRSCAAVPATRHRVLAAEVRWIDLVRSISTAEMQARPRPWNPRRPPPIMAKSSAAQACFPSSH